MPRRFHSQQHSAIVDKNTYAECKKRQYLLNLFHVPNIKLTDNMIQYAMARLSENFAKTILNKTKLVAKRRKMERVMSELADYQSGTQPATETIVNIARYPRTGPMIKTMIYKELQDNMVEESAPTVQADPVSIRLQNVAGLFNLAKAEQELLFLLFLCETDRLVDTVMDELFEQMDILRSSNPAVNVKPYSMLTGLPRSDLEQAMKKESSLIGCGLVSNDQEPVGYGLIASLNSGYSFTVWLSRRLG